MVFGYNNNHLFVLKLFSFLCSNSISISNCLYWESLISLLRTFVFILLVFFFFLLLFFLPTFRPNFTSGHLQVINRDRRIGMLSLVTVSLVITAFHSCCLWKAVITCYRLCWPDIVCVCVCVCGVCVCVWNRNMHLCVRVCRKIKYTCIFEFVSHHRTQFSVMNRALLFDWSYLSAGGGHSTYSKPHDSINTTLCV